MLDDCKEPLKIIHVPNVELSKKTCLIYFWQMDGYIPWVNQISSKFIYATFLIFWEQVKYRVSCHGFFLPCPHKDLTIDFCIIVNDQWCIESKEMR